MTPYKRKPARSITFTDGDGKTTGKVTIGETGARGNRHFNPRRPGGPTCGQVITVTGGSTLCGERWQPVCPNRDCPGNYEVRQVMRIEKYGRKRHEKGAHA